MAALAGTCFDPASSESGGYESGVLGAKAMATEAANAAAEIWCSEVPVLKSLVKCFVAVGAKAAGALAEENDQLMGPSEISQDRNFLFRMHKVCHFDLAEQQQQQQQQQAAMKAAKEYLEEMQGSVQNCIQSLKKKQSSSIQFLHSL